jgi:hypothetical protein
MRGFGVVECRMARRTAVAARVQGIGQQTHVGAVQLLGDDDIDAQQSAEIA